MKWNRWAPIAAMCATALFVISIPAQSSAELEAWDQEEVTQLAQQLSEAVTTLRLATIHDPLLGQAVGTRGKNLRDIMKAMETACRQLARKLAAGEDRSKTTGVGKKIGMLIREAQLAGRKVMVNESQWAAIDPVVDLINRLSPYYSDKSPLLPPSQQR